MKILIFAMLAAALLTAGCQKNPTTNVTILSDDIGEGASSQIISDFMTDTKLFSLADHGQAGIFAPELFQIHAGNEGIMLWFCYNDTTNEFFVALEQLKKYSEPLPDFATTNSLTLPYVFTYYKTGDDMSPGGAVDHLRNDVHLPINSASPTSKYVYRTIDSAQANYYIKQFRIKQSKLGTLYCKKSFSCFGEDSLPATPVASSKFIIKKLITPLVGLDAAGKPKGYVRYYFAYKQKDKSGGDMYNKIRVVLVPVDQTGKPSWPTGGGGPLTGGGGGGGVESSWPPPPPYP